MTMDDHIFARQCLARGDKFRIVPKRDFGSTGYLIKGKHVTRGFVVVLGGCNVMPGATWFQTVADAMQAIRVLTSTNNSDEFWRELMQRFSSERANP